MQEMWVLSLVQKDPLEKEMATHPVFLPGKPDKQEPGGLQSKESQRVGHDLATEHSTDIFPVSSFRLLNNNNNNKMAQNHFEFFNL